MSAAKPVAWPARAVLVRVVTALFLTAGLLLFMLATRLDFSTPSPTLSLRQIETMAPVSLPAPPPPPSAETPPPPPPDADLPKLDLSLDPVAPPIKASLAEKLELRLASAEFTPQAEAPRQEMVFSSGELDTQPRLINRPSITFPASQKAQGVSEGRVTLEVQISAAGRVTVRRILESSHPDFDEVARSFATRARFTSPNKDGRAVNAVFRWPLILRP